MNRNLVNVSDNEEQILETMWREDRPLLRSDIIELTVDKTWKESSIHILLNQLLDKELIEVMGFEKASRNYGRTYAPTLSKDEFDMHKLKTTFAKINPTQSTTVSYLSYLIEEDKVTSDDLKVLRNILDKKSK